MQRFASLHVHVKKKYKRTEQMRDSNYCSLQDMASLGISSNHLDYKNSDKNNNYE